MRIGVWYVLAGRALDLVEERRRLRAVLVVLLALYSAAIIASEIALPAGSGGPMLYLANAIGLLTITLVFAVVLLSVSGDSALISLPLISFPSGRIQLCRSLRHIVRLRCPIKAIGSNGTTTPGCSRRCAG